MSNSQHVLPHSWSPRRLSYPRQTWRPLCRRNSPPNTAGSAPLRAAGAGLPTNPTTVKRWCWDKRSAAPG
eukprot:6608831-Lingulodinium_polyedra.AAC.1